MRHLYKVLTGPVMRFTTPAALGSLSALVAAAGCSARPSADPTSTDEMALASASSSASEAEKPAQARYEAASVVVSGGGACSLHPEGVVDPDQTARFQVDEDGVARFSALRSTSPGAVDRLALDCTDSAGNETTYPVDLRSEATFAPRPFDASRTTLEARPALLGDPLSLTQAELLDGGYGLRPDPATNAAGYARWLRAARTPMHKLRSVDQPSSAIRSRAVAPAPLPLPDAGTASNTFPGFLPQWTGAVLSGSYQPGSQFYAANEAAFYVPSVTPGEFGTANTAITIWNGLDNVFQAIVDVITTASSVRYGIHRQSFSAISGSNTQGVNFTPRAGDEIWAQEWYCDATGTVNVSGGYECSIMEDITQSVVWECDKANSTTCVPFQAAPGATLGFWADFVVENDTDEFTTGSGSDGWTNFSPAITMSGAALVVQGNSAFGHWLNVLEDPHVTLAQDWTTGLPTSVNVSVGGTTGSNSQGFVQWASPHHSDLSNIGTGNFNIAFTLSTTQNSGVVGVLGQRATCSRGDFWDIRLVNGHVNVETDDGTHYTSLQSPGSVADGNFHSVLVQRVAGNLTIAIDGVQSTLPSGLLLSAVSSASFGTLAPAAGGLAIVYGCVNRDGTVPFSGPLSAVSVYPE